MSKIIKNLLNAIADEFKPEAIDIVRDIENGIMTTKGHYGRYMSALSAMPKGIMRQGLALALARNGAGRGLSDALRVMGETA